MKLRIINDTGAVKRTKVLTENGENLAKYIRKMTLHFPLGDIVTADVELINITIEAFAELGAVTQKEVKDG